MRSHRGHEAPSPNQGMVWVVVLLLAAGGGTVLYFVARSPGASAPPATGASGLTASAPSSSSTARAVAGAEKEPPTPAEIKVPRGPLAPTDPLPEGVDEWFDEETQRLRVRVRGIDLEEGLADSWRMEASWQNPGRVRQRPTVVHWLVVHKVASGRTLKVDDFVELKFDDGVVGITTPHYSWVAGAETCRWTTTLDDFLYVSATKKITVQLAAKEWTLSREALAILRTFAAVVPAR